MVYGRLWIQIPFYISKLSIPDLLYVWHDICFYLTTNLNLKIVIYYLTGKSNVEKDQAKFFIITCIIVAFSEAIYETHNHYYDNYFFTA
jgi:hypothetical protein